MKTIKLTEQNLTNIVKKIIEESKGAKIGKTTASKEYYDNKIKDIKNDLMNTPLNKVYRFNLYNYMDNFDIKSMENPDLSYFADEIKNIQEVIHYVGQMSKRLY